MHGWKEATPMFPYTIEALNGLYSLVFMFVFLLSVSLCLFDGLDLVVNVWRPIEMISLSLLSLLIVLSRDYYDKYIDVFVFDVFVFGVFNYCDICVMIMNK